MAELNGPKMKECKKMGWKEKTMIIQCWKQQRLKGRNDTFPGGMNYEYRSHWGGKAYKKEGLIQQNFFNLLSVLSYFNTRVFVMYQSKRDTGAHYLKYLITYCCVA